MIRESLIPCLPGAASGDSLIREMAEPSFELKKARQDWTLLDKATY